jgi:transposase
MWAIKQLTLPLRASHGRAKRRYQTPPPQSQPAISVKQRAQALARVAAGDSYRRIARDFGVSYGAIYRLVRSTRAAQAPQAQHVQRSPSHATGEEGTR